MQSIQREMKLENRFQSCAVLIGLRHGNYLPKPLHKVHRTGILRHGTRLGQDFFLAGAWWRKACTEQALSVTALLCGFDIVPGGEGACAWMDQYCQVASPCVLDSN